LNQHWQKKNASKKNCATNNLQNGQASPVRESMAVGG
jgi:hypothetical protein